MDQVKVTEAKLLRGAVISKLYDVYGTDIRIGSLKNMLRARGFVLDEEIKKAIFYLGGTHIVNEKKDVRYIHVEVNEDNWLDGIIWLTPAGVNLAEKDREDIGVIFEDE